MGLHGKCMIVGDVHGQVVSGHVKQPSVVMSEKRILVDTTGGRGGVLSAVLLTEKTVF